MRLSVYRRATFNAAHRLHNPNWSDEKNREIYGLCNNKNFHGHNYVLVTEVIGEIDPESGFVMDLKILNNIIKKEVVELLDHRNLNEDIPDFKNLIPTAENIAVVIWNKLRQQIDRKHDLRVRLYETERNFVEYGG